MEDASTKTLHMTLDDLLFVNIPSKARCEVIEASVTIEKVITMMLAQFLNIDADESKSFGKSGLSFNAKLNLLADINLIDKVEKTKLIKFSEIRNIFAHDDKTFTFFQCFRQIGLKGYLLSQYGEQHSKHGFQEENDRMLFEKLFEDVKETCRQLFHKMMDKAKASGRQIGTMEFFDNLQHVLAKMSETDPVFKAKVDQAYEDAKSMWRESNKDLSA